MCWKIIWVFPKIRVLPLELCPELWTLKCCKYTSTVNSSTSGNIALVNNDMTKLERDQCKELVSEARSLAARDPAGEYLYRVRGPPGEMKILKFRKRQ